MVNVAVAALYPNGTVRPSVPGPECRIYRGWPNSASLDADLNAGVVNVTVFPVSGSTRTTTRYSERWIGAPRQPTLTAQVSGTTVTFGGTAGPGQVAGILVNGRAYAYRIQTGDNSQSVAANLASMLRPDAIVQLSASSMTIAGAHHLLARVVADAPVKQEVRRQEQGFRMTCWCPTPATRDATAITLDQALSTQYFLPLGDGTSARLTYGGTTEFDQSQNARLYRRDLTYVVEYATIVADTLPAMLFGGLALNAASVTV
ncbi:MAG TPA: hypothetical protein VH855_17640 [Acetobacteraceae bacterium]